MSANPTTDPLLPASFGEWKWVSAGIVGGWASMAYFLIHMLGFHQ